MPIRLGLEVHVGHGLTYDTVTPVAAFPEVMELNIGHFLIGEAIFRGLEPGDCGNAPPDGRGARVQAGRVGPFLGCK